MGRIRRVGSVKQELLQKSKEAALSAVQIFNNPNISFKAETYIVLMIIAWTYLLHAFYRSKGVEYRYFQNQANGKRKFDRTKKGAYKFWELEKCLNDSSSPLDKDTSNNLRFLIGIRHEIEHRMTTRIDDALSAKFQACCLNYDEYLRKLFDDSTVQRHLSFSLQFSSISDEQKEMLSGKKDLPGNIKSYILEFEQLLSDIEYESPKYAYRILFVPKTANRKGQADQVIEFVKSDSELAEKVNAQYAVVKETERPKFLAGQVVSYVQSKGFGKFRMHEHTMLVKQEDAKNTAKGFGVMIAGKDWRWYQSWLDFVLIHCQKNKSLYEGPVSSKKGA